MDLAKQAEREYIIKMKVLARGVKRGTKKSQVWLDHAESAARAVEHKYCHEVKKLDLPYGEECDKMKDIRITLDCVDRCLFIDPTVGMYSFTYERLLKVLEM